jgi:choice-of-anchor C domain-containing protein
MTVSGLLKTLVPTIGVRTSVGATLVAVFCAGLSLAAEFQNGSFEEGPVLPVCNIFNIPVGDSTTITGWTVIEGNIDWEGPPPCGWVAAQGDNSVDLVGQQTKGGVEQTFDTIPGETYEVTFSLAGNFGGLPVIKPLAVTVAGDTHNFTFDSTGASQFDMHWTVESFTFVAPSASTTIAFVSDLTGIGSNAGAVIDAVSIELASARATAPVLGVPGLLVAALGLFALGIFWRRRSARP